MTLAPSSPPAASVASVETVADLMAPPTVRWQVEKVYAHSSRSEPPDGHLRLTDAELKRLRFDKQLEMAESLLRRRELGALDAAATTHQQLRRRDSHALLRRGGGGGGGVRIAVLSFM